MTYPFRTACLILSFFFFINTSAQTAFFRSEQNFSSEQLTAFYSSFTIKDNDLFFIANDYKLYAYDLATKTLKWNIELNYKSKRPCFVHGNLVFAPYYQEKHEWQGMFDRSSGQHLRTLAIDPMHTNPVIKDSILYGTAIYEGGTIFAYDIPKDTILWWRFLAHGVSTQPYFFDQYIHANAESDNWVRFDYNGNAIDTTCKTKADIFVQDISCIRNFNALTHDGMELTKDFSKKVFDNEEAIAPENTIYGKSNSGILFEDQLVILGKKKKLIKKIDLNELLQDEEGFDSEGLRQILDVQDETIQFMYGHMLVRYNFKKEKVESLLNLSKWEPTQVSLRGAAIWLISRKDGLLYGLDIVPVSS